jgi:hypothetical protein
MCQQERGYPSSGAFGNGRMFLRLKSNPKHDTILYAARYFESSHLSQRDYWQIRGTSP